MMLSEFVARTGFEPLPFEYENHSHTVTALLGPFLARIGGIKKSPRYADWRNGGYHHIGGLFSLLV